MIKPINKSSKVNNYQVPTESFCDRLAEELEERHELVTCENNYCSHWYVN